jgi:hypothetical protein
MATPAENSWLALGLQAAERIWRGVGPAASDGVVAVEVTVEEPAEVEALDLSQRLAAMAERLARLEALLLP